MAEKRKLLLQSGVDALYSEVSNFIDTYAKSSVTPSDLVSGGSVGISKPANLVNQTVNVPPRPSVASPKSAVAPGTPSNAVVISSPATSSNFVVTKTPIVISSGGSGTNPPPPPPVPNPSLGFSMQDGVLYDNGDLYSGVYNGITYSSGQPEISNIDVGGATVTTVNSSINPSSTTVTVPPSSSTVSGITFT